MDKEMTKRLNEPTEKQLFRDLAKMGVIIVNLANPKELHETLAEALDEEYLLDRKIHSSNKEWTDQ